VITIYKYQLAAFDTQDISMPKGAKLLTVQFQCAEPCLWAMVDTDQPKVLRRLCTVDTGQAALYLDSGIYVGTFQLYNGSYVGHVFDLGEI
jgi:hypothetical protein